MLFRSAPEVDAAALVGAVLGPHDRVHGQLEAVGRSSQDLVDPHGLVVCQAEGTMEWLTHDGHRTSRPLPSGPFHPVTLGSSLHRSTYGVISQIVTA